MCFDPQFHFLALDRGLLLSMVSPNWQGNKLSVAKNSYLSIDGDMLSTATLLS